MKKRILPILLLLCTYLYAYDQIFSLGLSNSMEVNINIGRIIFGIVIIVSILNMIYPFVMLRHGENSRTLLFWNMLLKLLNIPIFIIIWFSTSMLALMAPFVILFAIVFDYILLLSSSMYGVSGLIKAYREGKITVIAFIINIILHLIFCMDVISAVVMYITVKRDDKTQPILIADNENNAGSYFYRMR